MIIFKTCADSPALAKMGQFIVCLPFPILSRSLVTLGIRHALIRCLLPLNGFFLPEFRIRLFLLCLFLFLNQLRDQLPGLPLSIFGCGLAVAQTVQLSIHHIQQTLLLIDCGIKFLQT